MANVKLSAIAGAGAIAGADTIVGVQSGTTDVQYTYTNSAAFFAAATSTLTNKTYDTAGTGNVFKINGTGITAVTGTNSVVLSTAPTLAGQLIVTMPVSGTTVFVNGNTSGEIPGGHRASIHVQGPDSENCGFHIDAFGASTMGTFFGRHALGTAASPTAETADTQLVRVMGRGYRATSYSNNIGGLAVSAAGTFTDTSTPTYVTLLTCPSGSTNTTVENLRGTPGGGISVGNAAFNATDRATGVLAAATSLIVGAGSALTSTGAGGALGTAAFVNTGTSGGTVPLLNAANTFSAVQTINGNTVASPGSIASSQVLIVAPDTARTALELQTFGTGANTFARVVLRRFGGTAGTPTATPAASVLGGETYSGYDGAALQNGAEVRATSINLWSGSDRSAFLDFFVTPSATTTFTNGMRLQGSGGLSVGPANVGTDPGAGGLLATTVTIGAGAAITSSGAGGALGTNAFTSTAYLPLSGGTLTGNLTISGAGFLTSGSLSAAAWTTNGVRTQMAAASYTDTTSSGTVANAYTDLFGVGTILASSATTYTNYYGAFFKAPVASTNVTFTNKYAIGADTISIGGATGNNALDITGNMVISGTIQSGNNTVGASNAFIISGRSKFYSNANGEFDFGNNSGSTAYAFSIPVSNNLQFGAADAASAVAQKLSFQSVVAGNANTAGANATIQGSLSNGNGGGDILIKTTLSVAASGTQNTAATALTIKGGTQNVVAAAALTSASASGGIGYSTGAGGTVTQATNKSTGVTLNTTSGQITMNNATLAGQTEVSFTLTNSAIAATDVVLVSIASGATANSYVIGVGATAAGSCVIQLGNVTLATTLGEAIVLNFVVIKGVTS